jgi:hypothetical protein
MRSDEHCAVAQTLSATAATNHLMNKWQWDKLFVDEHENF